MIDVRLLSLVFLLLAGVLPLRELSSNWAGRADRRTALRVLWGAYAAISAGAVAALVLLSGREDDTPPSPVGTEQIACAGAACAGEPARA